MRNEKEHIPYPNSAPETEYYHFTINGNMQAYIYDNLIYRYYGYDNANSRKYKISYQNTPTWINGQPMPTELHIRNMMFYPNSYINFNNDGYYTKHYYNGMERIASRLGDQGFGMEQPTDGDLLSRKNDLGKVFTEQFQEMLGNQDSIKLHDTLQLRDLQPNPAGGLYFYHTNHLGSTAYVTDENQSVVQGFLYAPFGEITNEYNSSFGNNVLPKYSFNAKELDEETGMYYYEARYMAPPVFISRDPLFEKYPTFSPYAYCANNPVKYVDPTGEEIDESTVTDNIRNLVTSNKEFAKVYKQLQDDKTTVFKFFQLNRRVNDATGLVRLEEIGDGIKKKDVVKIYYTWDFEASEGEAAERALCEEVYHAKQFLDGDIGFGFRETGESKIHITLGYDKEDEKEAIDWSAKITGRKSRWEDESVEGYYKESTHYDVKKSAEQGCIEKIGAPAYSKNGVAIVHQKNDSYTFRKPKVK